MALADTAQLVVDLRLNDQLSGGVSRAESQLAGLNRTASSGVGATGLLGGAMGRLSTVAAGVGGAMSHAGSQLKGLVTGPAGILGAIGGTYALAEGFKSVVTSATSFEQQMELIATQAGASQGEVDAMSKSVLALATSVGTAPDQLAMGLYHIESAGLRGAKALEVLKVSAEGAKIGNTSLENTTNAVVTAIQSGIKGVQDYGQAMGTLNAIVGAGNMRMEDLNQALGSSAIFTSASAFGLTIQQVGGALASMADQSGNVIDSATKLRMAIFLLGAPSSAAAKNLKAIGLSTSDVANAMRGPGGLVEGITVLREHMMKAGFIGADGKVNTAGAEFIGRSFGGGRSSAGILQLVDNLDLLKTKTDAVVTGAGNFGDAWTKTTQEAEFRLGKFQASLGVLAIRLGDAILPTLSAVADAAGNWLGDPANQQSLVGALTAAMDTAKSLGAAIKDFIIPPISAIAGAWNALPGPLKEFLVGGFVANKAAGWLFGTSPLKVGTNLLSGLLGPLLGKVPVVGGALGAVSGVQHVWVDNMGAGGLGGGGVPLAPAAGGAGLLGTISAAALGAVIVGGISIAVKSGALNDLFKQVGLPTNWTDPALNAQSASVVGQTQKFIADGHSLQELEAALAGVKNGLSQFSAGPIDDLLYGQQKSDLENARKALEAAIVAATGTATHGGGAALAAQRDMDKKLPTSASVLAMLKNANITLTPVDRNAINHMANVARDALVAMREGLAKLDPKAAIKAAQDLVKVYASGTATDLRWIGANEQKVAALAAAFDAHGDHVTAAALRAELVKLEGIGAANAQHARLAVVAAEQNVRKTQAVHDKLARLNADENSNAGRTVSAIHNQKPPQVSVTVNASTSVSITDIAARTHTQVVNGNTVYYGNRTVGTGMGSA